MEDLIIAKSFDDNSPGVKFIAASGVLKIEGGSYMERPGTFYEPITAWIHEYMKSGAAIEFHFKINYFNSSSSKSLVFLLLLLKKYLAQGADVKVHWHYEDSDLELEEEIDDFEIATDLEIERHTYKTSTIEESLQMNN